MQPITKEYSVLFNAITDATESLNELNRRLKYAQQLAEEIYISTPDSLDNCESCLIEIKELS